MDAHGATPSTGGASTAAARRDPAPPPPPRGDDLNLDALLDDVANAVNDYVADGFDAFDTCVLESLSLTPEQAQDVLKGSVDLHDKLQSRVDTHLAAFENVARAGPLALPPAALGRAPPTPATGALPSPADEADVDAALAEARAALRAARGRAARARRELAAVEAELSSLGTPAAGGLAAVPRAAPPRGGGKENVASDAAAVAAKTAALAALGPRVTAARAAAAAARAGAAASRADAGAVEAAVDALRAAAGGAGVAELRRMRELVAPVE